MLFGSNPGRSRIVAVIFGGLVAGIGMVAEPSYPAPDAGRTDGAKTASPLVWDAMEKVLTPKPGESNAGFQFTVTNISDKPVTIEQIRPSCGCTVAEMPADPWVVAPHGSGTFIGNIDFTGKDGTVTKALYVNSVAGTQRLLVTVKIPTLDEAARKENQRIAQANRQAVFQGKCAECHLAPTVGKTGAELFTAACGVCHFSERRASIVPDLLIARQHRDAAFWRKWISAGKEGSLMPAWSKKHGGPLDDAQIDSLVKFALEMLPTEPPEK